MINTIDTKECVEKLLKMVRGGVVKEHTVGFETALLEFVRESDPILFECKDCLGIALNMMIIRNNYYLIKMKGELQEA